MIYPTLHGSAFRPVWATPMVTKAATMAFAAALPLRVRRRESAHTQDGTSAKRRSVLKPPASIA